MTTWPPSAPGTATAAADSELLTLAVAQVLLGVRSEARWLRLVPAALPGAFPYLPGQSGDHNRLHAAWPLLRRLIRMLAADTNPSHRSAAYHQPDGRVHGLPLVAWRHRL
jgi:hypothetical protein